jgi:hypothetical protein
VYVETLLGTHKRYKDLVDTAFMGDSLFMAALDKV